MQNCHKQDLLPTKFTQENMYYSGTHSMEKKTRQRRMKGDKIQNNKFNHELEKIK